MTDVFFTREKKATTCFRLKDNFYFNAIKMGEKTNGKLTKIEPIS